MSPALALPSSETSCLQPRSTPAALPQQYEADLLVGTEHFDTLRRDWEEAIGRMERPSVFLTPRFLEASWRHLAEPGDEAWFVRLRQAGRLVGLLPLVLSPGRYLGLPVRSLTHMGMLAGDRPGIVATIDRDTVWRLALLALLAHRAHWQVLDLREIDEGDWPLGDTGQALLAQAGLITQVSAATWAGCLPIQGSWADYFQTRSSQTRQSFRRAERQLKEACPDLQVEVIDDARQITAACERYLAIEARGWKAQAGVELWSDPRKQQLLRDLLVSLAPQGSASVWLLRSGGRDIAGLIRLRQGSVMFERHWTYDPEFHKYSPGTYLRMLAVQQLFGGPCDESDALGMDEPLAQRRALASWYPIERRTYRLNALNLPWYHRALYRLSRVAKAARDHWRARQAAGAKNSAAGSGEA